MHHSQLFNAYVQHCGDESLRLRVTYICMFILTSLRVHESHNYIALVSTDSNNSVITAAIYDKVCGGIAHSTLWN